MDDDFFSGGEYLHPDLREYVNTHPTLGNILQHPLVYAVPFTDHPILNKHLNAQYKYKKEAIEEAKNEKNWGRYIVMHERAYRLDAIMTILYDNEIYGEDYWELIGDFWTDSENIHQNFDEWRELWEADQPDREMAMNQDEREAFAKLPDQITVYRGVGDEEAVENGLSWTTDKAKAEWFARRFSRDTPYIGTGKVMKEDVLAYFMGRNESEIVVLPENVSDISVKRLRAKRKKS